MKDERSKHRTDRGRGCGYFDALVCRAAALGSEYRRADLPPLLEFADGRPVRTLEEWSERRAEIRRLMEETFMGTFPENTPRLIEAQTVSETREDDGSLRRRVRLTFDTPSRISFEICLWIPEGEGPFPVMLTVPVEWQVDFKCLWPQAALKRGYMACLYPGVSFTCRPGKGYESYKGVLGEFRRDYPQATMADLPGNAWIAGRALDYLLDAKYACPVEKNQICIIGHSRYGKQSLIAAALDERITSVVAQPRLSRLVPVPVHLAQHLRRDIPSTSPATGFSRAWALITVARTNCRSTPMAGSA